MIYTSTKENKITNKMKQIRNNYINLFIVYTYICTYMNKAKLLTNTIKHVTVR